MSDDFEYDKFLEQLGDDTELNPCPGSYTGGDGYTYSDTQYCDGGFDMDGYQEEVMMPAIRPFGGAASSMQHNWFGDETIDEIEEFGSSDPSGYGMSSPTPSHPRGLAIPAAPQASMVNKWTPAPQQTVASAYIHPYNAGPSGNRKHNNGQPSFTRGGNQQERIDTGKPRNAHGLRLRPVSDLPDIYRGIFKFGVFNAVQSRCYQTIMETCENIVASAPTGGGKTVLFELGLIAMLMDSGHQSAFKCVYVAPTKALCSERSRDWTAKFEPLGVKCCEMTGDTFQMGKSAWTAARNAKIIITTSEKWDSLTRGWHDHGDFLSEVRLFLVDEVHVINEKRGSTLEVVISRMKARAKDIRFILVSATVPNVCDIADWIGNPSVQSSASATVYEFGEEYRPCRITRHIYGFPRKNQNDFQFARTLDYKLYSVFEKHACGKPILVFCSTRKGVLSTAEQLLKEHEEALNDKRSTAWVSPRELNRTFHDKRLEKLAKAGLGVHHAGLSLDDRRAIEDLYLDGTLRVICATSTLAVGVNLPAHTVIIKGVKLYVGNCWQEYSDLDVIQMIGRAGRPQFDKEGSAIIMCEHELENKYRNLAQGKTILESSLHENLLEHINSEIGIRAIVDVQSAKAWLRNSFLRRRIQKNPGHYHIGKTVGQTWEEKIDDMVLQAVKTLESNELINSGGRDKAELSVTEYGDLMSKYYIRQSTMGRILNLSDRPTLEVISCAEELSDVRLRGGDKQIYSKMKDHTDIRYKLKRIEKASDKAFILIQAVLGGISLSAQEYKTADSQPTLDALSIFRHVARIARVVVEVAIIKKNGAQLKHGLELMRCLTAKAWEDRPVVLKQIESIGEKSLKVLADSGITSLQSLMKQEPSRIEMLLNRRAPYGHEVLQFVKDLPQYGISINVDRNGIATYAGRKPVSVVLNIECCLLQALPNRKKSKHKPMFLGMTNVLTITSDLDFIDFRRTSTKSLREPRSFTVTAELAKPSQSICVLVSSDNLAGLTVTQSYKPSVPAKEYPTLNTHPKSENDLFLKSLEDDPDFWEKAKYDDLEDDLETKQVSPILPARLPLEPRTLSNGNYACNHNCRDKSICRHLCCREGTSKPPSATKRPSDEKKESAKGNTGTTKKRSEKKAAKEERMLGQLESLHKRVGISESLGLSEGQRLKLDAGTSTQNPRSNTKPNFDVQFAVLKEKPDKDDGSSDELPDARGLLRSPQRKKLPRSNSTPDDSFSNSELDAIMSTMDTTGYPSGSADTTLTNPATLLTNDSRHYVEPLKRKNSDTEISMLLPSEALIKPASKKTKRDDQILTRPNDDPLFLHLSSMSSPSLLPSTTPRNTLDSKTDDFTEDDLFTPDESIFNIISPGSIAVTGDATDNIAEEKELNTRAKQGTVATVNRKDDVSDCQAECREEWADEWADMEDWLLNSGSVQIVG